MLKREAEGLRLRSRGCLITDQSLDGVSAPPGKRHPAPMTAIGSAMGLGVVSTVSAT